VLERAVLDRGVLAVRYVDKDGTETDREIEPVGFVGAETHWYLVAWCRLREGGRAFRLDRILDAHATGETAPERAFESVGGDIVAFVRRTDLLE